MKRRRAACSAPASPAIVFDRSSSMFPYGSLGSAGSNRPGLPPSGHSPACIAACGTPVSVRMRCLRSPDRNSVEIMSVLENLRTEADLEDRLSAPSDADIECCRRLDGDVMVLGAAGKMG